MCPRCLQSHCRRRCLSLCPTLLVTENCRLLEKNIFPGTNYCGSPFPRTQVSDKHRKNVQCECISNHCKKIFTTFTPRLVNVNPCLAIWHYSLKYILSKDISSLKRLKILKKILMTDTFIKFMRELYVWTTALLSFSGAFSMSWDTMRVLHRRSGKAHVSIWLGLTTNSALLNWCTNGGKIL